MISVPIGIPFSCVFDAMRVTPAGTISRALTLAAVNEPPSPTSPVAVSGPEIAPDNVKLPGPRIVPVRTVVAPSVTVEVESSVAVEAGSAVAIETGDRSDTTPAHDHDVPEPIVTAPPFTVAVRDAAGPTTRQNHARSEMGTSRKNGYDTRHTDGCRR